MYAIVDIQGQQFKVEKDQRIFVHRLSGEEGTDVSFEKVLLVDNDGLINVGAPNVPGASVSAKILAHVRGDKVLIFKKNRRKGYQKLNGHRQDLTQILVDAINVDTNNNKKSVSKPDVINEADATNKADAIN